jgi:molybdate transport system substrate-binding protein
MFSRWLLAVSIWLACSCGPHTERSNLTVAAAANLTGVLDQIAGAFQAKTGIAVVISYGSTAQLSQQIENGAPFDVFAAADTEHVDQLIAKGKIALDSRAVYARGALALWVPKGEHLGVRTLGDLAGEQIRFIALAQPESAPYGRAALEAMATAGLWGKLQPKLVYASNISLSRQFAATGNADAAFTAHPLVLKDTGTVIKVDPKLYRPIDQALGVVASSMQPERASQFAAFLLGSEAKEIFRENGYEFP